MNKVLAGLTRGGRSPLRVALRLSIRLPLRDRLPLAGGLPLSVGLMLGVGLSLGVGVAAPASAHTLDEYVQATLVSVEASQILASVRLKPGVEVFPEVFRVIDADADGKLSKEEEAKYLQRVIDDLAFSVDGTRLEPRMLWGRFPPTDDMKEGRGEILIELAAPVSARSGARKLVIENRHQPRISAYLANTLVPRDPRIRIVTQTRSANQSVYELQYLQP